MTDLNREKSPLERKVDEQNIYDEEYTEDFPGDDDPITVEELEAASILAEAINTTLSPDRFIEKLEGYLTLGPACGHYLSKTSKDPEYKRG